MIKVDMEKTSVFSFTFNVRYILKADVQVKVILVSYRP